MPNKAAKRPLRKTFMFNLILIILICLVLYWLFFAALGSYTRHGEYVVVPEVTGMQLNEIENSGQTKQFSIEVDSAFYPDKKPLEIISQQPSPNSKVKVGHTLLLTVNKTTPPSIPMPSLTNLSYRSAKMLLENNKLVLEDTIMKPDLAQGAVLDQLYQNKTIAPGTPILQGSGITLVIGDGLGNTRMNVPKLLGLSYPEAIAMITGSNLTYEIGFVGNISDTFNAIVVEQTPQPVDSLGEPNQIDMGEIIYFKIKQDADPD